MNPETRKELMIKLLEGEKIFLMYPNMYEATYDFSEIPKGVIGNRSERTWRLSGTEGAIKFSSVSLGVGQIRGVLADIRFMDGAECTISAEFRREAWMRSQRYKTQRAREQTKRIWEEYYAAHRVCPQCGEVPERRTYVGYVNPPDDNLVNCSCGWEGVVDDLIGGRR